MMIGAGRRDRFITIQRKSLAGTGGSPDETVSTQKQVWANYRGISGGEVLKMGQERGKEIAEFTILYCDVIQSDQILWNAKTWDILSIREIGRQEMLILTAEARE